MPRKSVTTCYDVRISELQRRLLHQAVHCLNTSEADLTSAEMEELDVLFDLLKNSAEAPLIACPGGINSFVL